MGSAFLSHQAGSFLGAWAAAISLIWWVPAIWPGRSRSWPAWLPAPCNCRWVTRPADRMQSLQAATGPIGQGTGGAGG